MVLVTWIDSASNPHWASLDDVVKDQHIVTCRTVGFLYEVSDREIRVVGTQSRRADGAGVFHALAIPRVAITDLRDLTHD